MLAILIAIAALIGSAAAPLLLPALVFTACRAIAVISSLLLSLVALLTARHILPLITLLTLILVPLLVAH